LNTKNVKISFFLFLLVAILIFVPKKAMGLQSVEFYTNDFTNDDERFTLIGGSPYLDAIDYPANYIASRSDRPSISAFYSFQSPVNMTASKGQMPQKRVDFYARTVNGSPEVIVDGAQKTVGSSWAWTNGTASNFFSSISYYPSQPSTIVYVNINNTIAGISLNASANGRVIYVYPTIWSGTIGTRAYVKGAIYNASDSSLLGTTEETYIDVAGGTIVHPTLEFADPKPFLVEDGSYYLALWANRTGLGSPYLYAETFSDSTLDDGKGFNQTLSYGDFPSALTPVSQDFVSYQMVYYVPEVETSQHCFDKRYLGVVEIDQVVMTYWNSTYALEVTPTYSEADTNLIHVGSGNYLASPDYPANYVTWSAYSGLSTSSIARDDNFYTFDTTPMGSGLIINSTQLVFTGLAQSSSIRYYLLSEDMSINYTATKNLGTSVTVTRYYENITQYVSTIGAINKLRVAFRFIGVLAPIIDSLSLYITYTSLNPPAPSVSGRSESFTSIPLALYPQITSLGQIPTGSNRTFQLLVHWSGSNDLTIYRASIENSTAGSGVWASLVTQLPKTFSLGPGESNGSAVLDFSLTIPFNSRLSSYLFTVLVEAKTGAVTTSSSYPVTFDLVLGSSPSQNVINVMALILVGLVLFLIVGGLGVKKVRRRHPV